MVGRTKRIAAAALALVLLTAGIAVWLVCGERETDRVKRRIVELCAVASSGGGRLGDLALAAKVRSVEKFFAPECHLELNDGAFRGGFTDAMIAANYLQLLKNVQSVHLQCNDFSEVRFPSAQNAEVDFTGTVSGRSQGREFEEVREMTAALQKIDGQWRINSVRIRDILRR